MPHVKTAISIKAFFEQMDIILKTLNVSEAGFYQQPGIHSATQQQ